MKKFWPCCGIRFAGSRKRVEMSMDQRRKIKHCASQRKQPSHRPDREGKWIYRQVLQQESEIIRQTGQMNQRSARHTVFIAVSHWVQIRTNRIVFASSVLWFWK